MAGYIDYDLELHLNTPAFLGGADQRAEWRTPPLKALLRQMWRLVVAKQVEYEVEALRKREGELFGIADKTARRRSQVMVMLGRWQAGTCKEWGADTAVPHPEVRNGSVGAQLYLGYGPLNFQGGRTVLSDRGGAKRTALGREQSTRLYIRAPAAQKGDIERTIQLVHLLGTIGGRSRNGWGSLRLERTSPEGLRLFDHDDPKARSLLESISRPLERCLDCDWPHALGCDGKGLLAWWTEPREKDDDVLRDLAKLKIVFRTEFEFPQKGPHSDPLPRHVLAYPVTNHQVKDWKNYRAPNQLRFKVIRDQNEKYRGFIFHIPWRKCIDKAQALEVWPKVHEVLDAQCRRWPK